MIQNGHFKIKFTIIIIIYSRRKSKTEYSELDSEAEQ